VKYKILPLENLPEETLITNEASIFFDFNEPIITNTTTNTLVSSLNNNTNSTLPSSIKVVPNPFDKTTIFRIAEIPEGQGTLNIYNSLGVLIFSENIVSNTDVIFNAEELAAGIYVYEVVTLENKRVLEGKLIKHFSD